MRIKRILATVLCLVILLSCLPVVGSAATEPVVYLDSVNGSDSNSGLTEAQAVATLTGAYTALKNNIGSATKGKIVLVNDYTFEFTSEKGSRRDIAGVDHSFEVVITGKTPQTALEFYLYTQCYIGMKGPTTFENVTVRIKEGSASSYLSIHGRGALTIGQGVTTSPNSAQRPSLSAGTYFSGGISKNLTVNSGDWANVYAGGYVSTMTGDAVLNFNGGTCNKIATNYSGTQNGNVTINMNGGTAERIITASANSSGKVNGDITVNLNGGTVTTEIDPDGVGTFSGTSTFNTNAANGLSLLCPNTVNVNNHTGGALTLGSATKLNIAGIVTGTTAVTVDPTVRYNFAYITAPTSTADNAFTFSQANMSVQTGTEKQWINADSSSGFTGLVLKVPSAQTVKLYPGVSGGSVITPDSTETADGYKYQYYANIMGTYRYITTQSGYYSTTKAIYMTVAESLTRTEVDATAAKKAGTGFEPSNVKDYTDEMLENKPSDETAPWWEDYGQYLTTPVFQEGRAEHQATTQSEMEAYIAGLDGANDNMYVYSIGKSEKYGYNIPIVIFTATDLSGAKTLEEAAALVNANNKVTVHYQAQIHGNEPAGGEAALALIGRLDTEYGDNLLQNLNIYVIPRVNPDGSHLYQRNSSTGINMNRDMLITQTAEVEALNRTYALFYPELAVDSHEYTYQPEESTGAYNDMMIACGHNGNSGKEFSDYVEFIARLPFDTLYSYNMQPSYYLNETNGKYAASTATYRGMRGSISLLLESRGIGGGNHTMERRVAAHLISMNEVLTYAAENSAELQAASDAERNRIANSGKTYEETDTITLEHTTVTDSSLNYTNKYYNLPTGKVTSTYTSTPKIYSTLDGRERARPTAYVIPAGESWTAGVLEKMDIQDIDYYFVEAGSSISLQQYTGTVEAASLTAEQYYTFPNGCYVMPMNQINGTILAILMEPDIIDEYNVDAGGSTETVPSGTLAQTDYIPCENEVFPIYRYVHDLNADGTINVTTLPDAPTGLTATTVTTAGGTGAITGLDATRTYEYRSAADDSYTAVAAGGTTISGLTVGTYYVRYAASGSAAASKDAVVEVRYGVLDSYTVYINSSTGADTNNGYTEATPVKTIAQAYKQLDSIMADTSEGTSAKIVLLADYDLGADRFTFPKHDYHVIFTAKTSTIALSKGGVASPQTSCAIDVSGPMTFEHLTLKITSSSLYNNFNGCGHKLVMGEGLTCVANSKGEYFMLGAGGFSATAVASTDLTVLSGTWEQIYAGGYTSPVTGDANLTVKNATVTTAIQASYNGAIGGNVNITVENSVVPTVYGGNANKNDVGGNVTITLKQGADVPTVYAGSRDKGNVVGTAKLIIDGANVPSTAKIYGKCKTSGTIGSFEVVLKNGSLAMIPTNINKVTVDTTAGGTVSYPASMGVDTVLGNGVGQVGSTAYAPLQYAANAGANSYVTLMADCTADVKLVNDLYLNMAGYDLGGKIDLGGHKLYGFDTTTDDYTDSKVGHLTATVTGGTPERQFKSDATRLGAIKRYLAVADENGYSFHRYYMAITQATIRPTTEGVGYKALFMGSDTVKAQIKGYGYTLQLGDCTPVTASSENFVSGKVVTLRVDNYDIATYGETALTANAFINFGDVVMQSTAVNYSLKDMVEAINANFSAVSTTGQQAMAAFVEKYYSIMQNWEVDNIYTPGTTVPDFENENEL